MNAMLTVAGITLRQLLSRRRTLLLLALGAVPVLLALAYRLSGDANDDADALSWTMGMLEYLGMVTVMPLIALIFGTGAIGGELEDGTAVHLLTKPVPRWQVGIAKFIVASVCAAALAAIPIGIAGLLGANEASAAIGYAVGAAIGATIYVAIFMALSMITSRSFVIGLGYVLIWEGLLAGLFPGIASLSVRQYAISFAQTVTDSLSSVANGLEPRVAIGAAIIGAGVVTVAALGIALRLLSRLEIAGETG
ncbi:MAG: ABC transporter permease [Chloroflexota bacterium]